MRLLGTAAAGLRAQQVALDTVSDNLANVNTPGFKASQPDFAEALAAEMRPAGQTMNGSPVGGSLNVGSGVLYNAVGTDFKQGTLVPSDNPLDLAIEGEGFFPVQLPNGSSAYTRVGNFQPDATGKLVNSEGQTLALRIPQGTTGITVDATGQVSGQLNGEDVVLGQILPDMNNQTPNIPLGSLNVDAEGRLMDSQGNLLPAGIVLPEGVSNISVNVDGTIRGKLQDQDQTFGIIPIVAFSNPSGLEKIGSSLFQIPTSGTVGTPMVGLAGSSVQNQELGKIRSQSLEQSNVDLATSMTDLIQVQRAYQMNARLISDGDQMWSMANSIRR